MNTLTKLMETQNKQDKEESNDDYYERLIGLYGEEAVLTSIAADISRSQKGKVPAKYVVEACKLIIETYDEYHEHHSTQ